MQSVLIIADGQKRKTCPRNGDEDPVRKTGRMLGAMTAIMMLISTPAVCEEKNEPAPDTPEEAGLAEIQGILDVQPVGDINGMDLETLTTTLTDNVMGEYYDPVSGFRMQYPSILQFDETEKGVVARSDDGSAQMIIETTPDGRQLTIQMLISAVRMEDPSATIREYMDPSCFLKEKTSGGIYRADIYALSGDWLHHVILTCPETEKETVIPFIEYMIYSMSSDDGDQG